MLVINVQSEDMTCLSGLYIASLFIALTCSQAHCKQGYSQMSHHSVSTNISAKYFVWTVLCLFSLLNVKSSQKAYTCLLEACQSKVHITRLGSLARLGK